MKKNLKNVFLISLISIFLLIFNISVKSTLFIYAESIMAAFMLVVIFLAVQMFGIQKDKNNRLKGLLFFQVAQILALYFIIIYLSGIYFGYSKIVFSLKPMSILNNTLAPIIIFFLIICTSCKDNKEIHEISFISSIGIDYKIDTNEYEVIIYFINNINNWNNHIFT